MPVSAAQQLLEQICSFEGLQTHMEELDGIAGPGFCSLLRMTITTVQECMALLKDNVVPSAEAQCIAAVADLEVIQEATWEKLHTGCWKGVHSAWRDAYALACLLHALVRLSVTCTAAGSQLLACAPAPPEHYRIETLELCHGQSNRQQQVEHAHSNGALRSANVPPSRLVNSQDQSNSCQDAHSQEARSASQLQGLRESRVTDEHARPPDEQQSVETAPEQLARGQEDSSRSPAGTVIEAAMRELDLGLMMGGLSFQEHLHAAMALAQRAWQQQGRAHIALPVDSHREAGDGHPHVDVEQGGKRKRATHDDSRSDSLKDGKAASAQWRLEESSEETLLKHLPPGSLSGQRVPSEHLPSLDVFIESYMCSGAHGQPCRITGAMSHWPALDRWQRPEYLLAVAGQRTVPIEQGKHYLEEGWGQSLVSLGDFMARHIMPPGEAEGLGGIGEADEAAAAAARGVGYLAQHPLFDQIPTLARDIREPEYCALGEGDLHSVNAWFGPAGTVTPLHHDPHHNLLAQAVGLKYVRLYPPAATPRLYPYQQGLTTNASQVDLDAPDLVRHPDFAGLPHQECLLRPGEMLYIPPGWWHYVRSLAVSFSVSFWWS